MRRIVALAFAATALALPGSALAVPLFGPGAGQGKGNNALHENPGTKCHPPGQTDDRSECK